MTGTLGDPINSIPISNLNPRHLYFDELPFSHLDYLDGFSARRLHN